MNTLTSFIYQNETVVVKVSSSINLKVRGVCFRDICALSNKHLKAMNAMMKEFNETDLKKYESFFDDILLTCIVSDEKLEIEDLKIIKASGRIKLLKEIFNLSIFDDSFLKKYKPRINKKPGKKQKTGLEIAEERFTERALNERFEALGFESRIEDIIIVCEYLISKNVTNAYDLSIRSLYNKFKIHTDIDKAERKKLINNLMAILYVHHGESDAYNELIESLSEI